MFQQGLSSTGIVSLDVATAGHVCAMDDEVSVVEALETLEGCQLHTQTDTHTHTDTDTHTHTHT